MAAIIEGRVVEDVDRWLGGFDAGAMRDRRNGIWRRHLLSELGDVELSVPRTRRYCPISMLKSHARRAPEIDRAIPAGFVLELGTCKVGEVLLALLRPSGVGVHLEPGRQEPGRGGAVEAFHARPLANHHKALMLDGVVLGRKTGAGALKRPAPVALGLRPDGKKEVIDFRLARSGSAAEWERFLDCLHRRGLTGDSPEMICRRGLTGDSPEMICVDGGKGLLAAPPRRQSNPRGKTFRNQSIGAGLT